MELLGFTINRRQEEKDENRVESIVSRTFDDGSIDVAVGDNSSTIIDLGNKVANDGELINRYREMALQPECDSAIQDIVNEAIIQDDDGSVIDIVLDHVELKESVKNSIRKEFNKIIELIDFNNNAYEIFKKWYIDGRLYFYIAIDKKNPKGGIIDARYVDPRKIKKIRESKLEKDKRTGADLYTGENSYYLYNPSGAFNITSGASGLKISKDSVIHTHSGAFDAMNNVVQSYLDKAYKPLNQLRWLEDAVVIYRLARAPERRIFYIDTGNLPKAKAEQYVREMMNKYKNKLVYNATTGEATDDRRHMTMLEDFWLPRREGGRGTEITTLQGGQNLGEMDDVEYFRRKLYKALNVPVSRLEADNSFNMGRASEISRDEIKFSKFISRLRNRFANIFDEFLEIQLAIKGIVTREEWKKLRQKIFYKYNEDNFFTELKNAEIWNERMNLLMNVEQHRGVYFSKAWIQKKVLNLSENDIKEIEDEIKEEASEGEELPTIGYGGVERVPAPDTVETPSGPDTADAPTGPDTPEAPAPAPEPTKEEREMRDTQLLEDEKKLVNSMTKFMDSMTTIRDDG